jgi:ABC-type sulfate transport system permease component
MLLSMMQNKKVRPIRVDFSLRRKVFFVVAAQVYVISPFVVLTASAGIGKVDINYDYIGEFGLMLWSRIIQRRFQSSYGNTML